MPELVAELVDLLGPTTFVDTCGELLSGADRAAYVVELRYLSGHPEEAVLDRTSWKDYWVRTWGARGLLHHFDERATRQVLAGLADEHYRPAEMCLKVCAQHDVAGSGPGAALLTRHELPRVRVAAARALGVVGDTEHADDLEALRSDPDEQVRRQAARAYERMAGRLDLRRRG